MLRASIQKRASNYSPALVEKSSKPLYVIGCLVIEPVFRFFHVGGDLHHPTHHHSVSLIIISTHHSKNRVIGLNFKRSDQIVCTCFHECLKTTIRCQKEFWKNWS
ncbi:hypothetical protein CICLE_v10013777mg [Citrus x clementina]|uniref:Uncharacterized protein n=1 Tax=Citrus clementina TaxID=85681 RepID=V4S2L9_CITCL|nr:hypothetical protein CICLE_v10013777mg [Citrus x clementina]